MILSSRRARRDWGSAVHSNATYKITASRNFQAGAYNPGCELSDLKGCSGWCGIPGGFYLER